MTFSDVTMIYLPLDYYVHVMCGLYYVVDSDKNLTKKLITSLD